MIVSPADWTLAPLLLLAPGPADADRSLSLSSRDAVTGTTGNQSQPRASALTSGMSLLSGQCLPPFPPRVLALLLICSVQLPKHPTPLTLLSSSRSPTFGLSAFLLLVRSHGGHRSSDEDSTHGAAPGDSKDGRGRGDEDGGG